MIKNISLRALLVYVVAFVLFGLFAGCESGSSSDNRPDKPEGLETMPGSKNGYLTLSWQEVSGATTYSIKYSSNEPSDAPKTIDKITETKYEFENLKPELIYRFAVVAHNNAGASSDSASVSHELELLKPDDAPDNLSAIHVTDDGTSTIAISWDKVFTATGYTLEYSIDGQPSETVSTEENEYTLTDISFDVDYSFRVTAVNRIGPGPTSASIERRFTAPPPFSITSATFTNGGAIPNSMAARSPPAQFTGGENKSPQLSWSNAPAGTSAFVIIMDDTTSPCGTGTDVCKHWSQSFPASQSSVAEGAADQSGDTAYTGPYPPFEHTYTIEIFALSESVTLTSKMNRAEFRRDFSSDIIVSAQITGTYTPPPPISITSDTFTNGGAMPHSMAANDVGGENKSPQLSWSNAPAGTSAFVIIMDDETNPCGTGTDACKHWSQSFPASQSSVAEGAADQSGDTAYTGPYPPFEHTYTIEIFALSESVTLTSKMNRAEFRRDFSSDIIVSAQITGTYTPPPPISITSDTFTNGGAMPHSMAANDVGGENKSPQLSWSNAPAGTSAFVIIMDDETNPCGTGTDACKHWSQSFSSSQSSIAEGAADQSGDTAYTGPYPPFEHTYTIEIFALSESVTLISKMNRAEFRRDFSSDIIGSAQITGTYTPPPPPDFSFPGT